MHIPLREPPPPVRPAFAVLALLLILVPSLLGLIAMIAAGKPPPTALLLPIVMFLVPVAGGLRRLFRKRRDGSLHLGDDQRLRIDLPGTPPLDAPLTSLRVLRAAKVGVVVGTEERALAIPASSLLPPLTPPDVVAHILERVRALGPEPNGAGDTLARFLAQRDAAAGAIEKRPLVVTWGISALIAFVFALELVAGAMDPHTPTVLLDLGAGRRDLIVDAATGWPTGLWRIPAAALLHGHLLHLGLNVMSLLVLGPVLERWLAKWRYVLVLLGSALVGTGASALLRDGAAGDAATVGLSGGLFGMLGALAITTLRYRRAPLVGPRLPLRSWIVLVVANGVLTAAPGVDAWAHVGGALAGALIALPLTPTIRVTPTPAESAEGAEGAKGAKGVTTERIPSVVKERAARIAAAVVLALFAAGVVGIVRAFFVVMTAS